MSITRRYHTPVIATFMDTWDSGDNWGSAMSAAWAVADVARAADVYEVSAILEINWGMTEEIDLDEAAATLEDRDSEDSSDITYETALLAADYVSGVITDSDLIFAARVLSRYLNLCKQAGLDY